MSLPYFPLYPDDFEADTPHLTMVEDGAYNRILRLCWRSPGCQIPADEAWLFRKLRAREEAEIAAVRAVVAEFFTEEKGMIYSPRLRLEWLAANEAHDKRVKAGSRGGKAKALKSNDSEPSNATAMLKQPEPEPEPEVREDRVLTHSRPSADFQASLDHFNATADRVGWPKVQRLTATRKAALAHRISDIGGEEAWRDAIDRAARSPLLTGQTGRGWRADFDWLCKAANFTKLCEGNYDPRPDQPGRRSAPERGAGGAHDSMVAAFAAVAGRNPH